MMRKIVVLMVSLIAVTFSACQVLQKDRSSDSRCKMTCEDCKGVVLRCDHATERVNRYTKGGTPMEEEDEYKNTGEDDVRTTE